MKVELIIPIERLRGKLRQDGYYFRLYRGQQIVQKCPTKWKDTPARKAARERFAARYAGNRTKKGSRNDARKMHREREAAESRGDNV